VDSLLKAMPARLRAHCLGRLLCPVLAALAWFGLEARGQDRLKEMPGYQRFDKMREEIPGAIKSGAVRVTWREGGKGFEYQWDGKRMYYDIAAGQFTNTPPRSASATAAPNRAATNTPSGSAPTNAAPGSASTSAAPGSASTNAPVEPAAETGRRRRYDRPPDQASSRERPARGRQYGSATSPDGQWRAFCRDRNLWVSQVGGTNSLAVTTNGSTQTGLKYGTASWVYGEELSQNTAIWWSADNRRVAFYRFDESQCRDYYLTLDETKLQNRLDVEPYPKVGATNPVVDLLIYDRKNKTTVTVDVRSGHPFENAVVGHYVYDVSWTADGKELLFHRTNRRQNILELCAATPRTGKTRVIVREEWPASWTENRPEMQFLKDGRRFIWCSERTGWKNYYLFNLAGELITTLTAHAFEVAGIVRVDEAAGLLYYMARSGDNPMKLQLHRVTLDGRGDQQLTDPAFHHTIDFAPDGGHFTDVAQTHDSPPTTSLREADGRLVVELARSDLTKYQALKLRPVELLTFKAADGRTDLYGLLHFPSNFKPYRKYPLLVSVYAGPETSGAHETFTLPNTLTEYGFLVATFDSRSASGRGKRFLDAIYQKLGVVEVDDQAAGVKALWDRRYVDKQRVGVFGTSYGGTASAMCLLRHPEAFQAACASSAVTDFRNYDTIYGERYMWLPQENAAGFTAASLMHYAPDLQGRLMIYYGTADNNVHPANALQLIQALQKARKSFEVQVGPDQGHSGLDRERMMEFFIENLVIRKPAKVKQPAG
jgi:dipeptidyl-peptidase-4